MNHLFALLYFGVIEKAGLFDFAPIRRGNSFKIAHHPDEIAIRRFRRPDPAPDRNNSRCLGPDTRFFQHFTLNGPVDGLPGADMSPGQNPLPLVLTISLFDQQVSVLMKDQSADTDKIL